MQFEIETGKISAIDHEKWAGEVSFPFVDQAANRVVVERVFVVPDYRGHGLAAQLMDQFVDYAQQNHLTVKIMCPYAKQYFKSHPEAQSLLLPEDRF